MRGQRCKAGRGRRSARLAKKERQQRVVEEEPASTFTTSPTSSQNDDELSVSTVETEPETLTRDDDHVHRWRLFLCEVRFLCPFQAG